MITGLPGYDLWEPMQHIIKLMPIKFKPMKWKLIKTEKEYQAALQRMDEIMDAKKGSREGDELELLSLLIENYEKEQFIIELPDPIDAIRFRMGQMGYKQKDLAEIIGLKSRVSEVLNKKRRLTLEMIRRIHEVLHIPTEVLIREY
jgi:HTH-type transcriptional regulator / antitoxin HigA